jgi:disulfide bond formation protein DsbB
MLYPRTRIPWLLVFGSALVLEMLALYFQYGMGLDPCVLCVYQRGAVLGIAIGGLIGAIYPQQLVVRAAGYLAIAASAALGLRFALQHVAVIGGSSFECGFLPDFPSWLPLHEWLPSLFQPTGMCGEIDWTFFGLAMPEVMIGVFAVYLAAIGYGLIAELITRKRIAAS